jgi:CubicO group peptidase (beta-lactamase class C family)
MKRLRLFLPLFSMLFLSTIPARAAAQSPILSHEAIRKIPNERLGGHNDRAGIVVGVIEPAGRRIITYGGFDKNDTRPLNGDTVLEIGLIAKVFTALLLAAQIGLKKSDLDPAIAATRSKWTPANPGMEMGLGWIKRPKKGSEIIWHNGGTGGYQAFAGFDPQAQEGVVVLINIFTLAGPDDIGFHLLDPESKVMTPDSPLLQPPKEHKEITLNSETLDLYVGTYELAPNIVITVARKDNQLFAQITGQGVAEIYPGSALAAKRSFIDRMFRIARHGYQFAVAGAHFVLFLRRQV